MSACDNVDSRYQTRKEAEAGQLFERGWLPSILPVSSYEIITKNDVDANVSEGEFHFRHEDLEAFISRLTRLPAEDSGEFRVYQYAEWTFLILPGGADVLCRYRMKNAK